LGEDVLEPYLRQVLHNFLTSPATALTGPLARGDQGTIARNLQSLQGDALQPLYQSFVKFHAAEQTQTAFMEANS
jgi:predicted short-subunit dehydrogenase-like oxidoreductase (DUF2520 family)